MKNLANLKLSLCLGKQTNESNKNAAFTETSSQAITNHNDDLSITDTPYNNIVLYLGGPGLKFQPRDQLS
jgi:hypothetical protein